VVRAAKRSEGGVGRRRRDTAGGMRGGARVRSRLAVLARGLAAAVAVTIGAGSGALELTSPWPSKLARSGALKTPGPSRRPATGAVTLVG